MYFKRFYRQHSLAVKQGSCYFHLLQKEEQEVREERATERRRKKELRLAELRPRAVYSDSDEDNDIERCFQNFIVLQFLPLGLL